VEVRDRGAGVPGALVGPLDTLSRSLVDRILFVPRSADTDTDSSSGSDKEYAQVSYQPPTAAVSGYSCGLFLSAVMEFHL
jgi:hypothetical protein